MTNFITIKGGVVQSVQECIDYTQVIKGDSDTTTVDNSKLFAVGDAYTVEIWESHNLTAEEKENRLSSNTEYSKQQLLDTIKVTTSSGKTFNGRDKDQIRMMSAIQASTLLGLTQSTWKLADNTITSVTIVGTPPIVTIFCEYITISNVCSSTYIVISYTRYINSAYNIYCRRIIV